MSLYIFSFRRMRKLVPFMALIQKFVSLNLALVYNLRHASIIKNASLEFRLVWLIQYFAKWNCKFLKQECNHIKKTQFGSKYIYYLLIFKTILQPQEENITKILKAFGSCKAKHPLSPGNMFFNFILNF